MSETDKIILNIDKEYLLLLKDEIGRKIVRELLKDLDILINVHNSNDNVDIMKDLLQLKDRLKDKVYEGFKDFYIAIDSYSKGINVIEFIKFKMKSE